MVVRAIAVLAVLVLAGCGSTVQPTAPALSSAPDEAATDPTAALTSPGASAPLGSPAAASARAIAEIRGGPLDPGRYTRSNSSPAVSFEVGEGWQGVQNVPGFFDVQQDPDTPDVIAVQFGNVDAVFGENGSSVDLERAADAVPIIRENPGLKILDESPS